MDSLAGHFLIASPQILDPNFHRAVVLITAHYGRGRGRPDPQPLLGGDGRRSGAAARAGHRPRRPGVRRRTGEPGGRRRARGVRGSRRRGRSSCSTTSASSRSRRRSRSVPPDFQRTRVFAGVAGWGPEQLEDELERDDWIIEPASIGRDLHGRSRRALERRAPPQGRPLRARLPHAARSVSELEALRIHVDDGREAGAAHRRSGRAEQPARLRGESRVAAPSSRRAARGTCRAGEAAAPARARRPVSPAFTSLQRLQRRVGLRAR